MLQRLHSENDDLMKKIADGEWGDDVEAKLGDAIGEAIDDFGPDFDEEGNEIEEGESDRVRERGGDSNGSSASSDSDSDSDDDSGSGDEEREEAGATA
jgi:hypothetical protein